MKLEILDRWVRHPRGRLKADYPVLDARQVEEHILVLYDHMAFPRGEPCRNLFAYTSTGVFTWRAENIGQGQTDAYTGFISESPLVVGNYSGFACLLDLDTGRVLSKVFTK